MNKAISPEANHYIYESINFITDKNKRRAFLKAFSFGKSPEENFTAISQVEKSFSNNAFSVIH